MFIDEKNNVHLDNFEKKQEFKVKFDIDISSHYKKDKYLEMCRDDFKQGKMLTAARKAFINKNKFRMSMQYLPSIGDLNNNPYENQNFKNNTDSIGVRIILGQDSMVSKNTFYSSQVSKMIKDWQQEIREEILEQMEKGFDGSVVINLDRKDDLACDLMKGRAQIEFYHFSSMDNPKIDKVSGVEEQDVKTLYSAVRSEVQGSFDPYKNIYFSGRVTEKLQQNNEIQLNDKDMSFSIVSKFFENNMKEIKSLKSDELTCLSDSHGEYEKKRYENAIFLNLKTPSVYELLEE